MGILQDFANAQAVNEALKNGVAAHEALNGHTVGADVPEGAKFTDTVYDDTKIKNDISANTGAINANKTDILSVNEKVDDLKAQGVQQTPLFAESVEWLEENGDTSKVYVLPDGYIYGYTTKTVVVSSTNQIAISIDSSGAIYNSTGWKTGYRLNSNGAETELSTYCVTGFIPAKFGDTLRFSNIIGENVSNTRICFYDSSFAFLNMKQGEAVYNAINLGEYSITETLESAGTMTSIEAAAYIRLSARTIDETSKITVNAPLENITTTQAIWNNTGIPFCSTDCDGENNVPVYVAEEAKRVAEIVQAKRTVGSLTFTAMSDFHVEVDTDLTYGVSDNMTSCRDAGYGLSGLQKYITLDFAATLGDYTWGDSTETVAQVKKDLTYVKNCLVDGMKGIPNIWCTGNHDINYGKNSERRLTEDELYAYITSNNKDTIQDSDNIGRNYGYVDFDNQKIRCIYLNTVDSLDYPDNMDGTDDDAIEITAVQAKWLVDVGLNLDGKSNSTEWGIVLLSHHCLSQFMPVTAILTAYKNGTNGSTEITTNGVTTAVNYDFTSENRGEIICAVHGHDHNFTYRKISAERWDKVTEENAWLWSIGVPNVDTTRNNEKATDEDESYRQVFGEFDSNGNPVYYPKTQGTATSTSFCIFTIDRKNRKVYATAYGAGVDREISY